MYNCESRLLLEKYRAEFQTLYIFTFSKLLENEITKRKKLSEREVRRFSGFQERSAVVRMEAKRRDATRRAPPRVLIQIQHTLLRCDPTRPDPI